MGLTFALFLTPMRWLKYSTVLALFLLLGLILWSFQDPICINSSVVKKVNINTSEGNAEIFSCTVSSSHRQFSPNVLRFYTLAQKDIWDFETFKEQIDDSELLSQTITLSLEKPLKYERSENAIVIGVDLFKDRDYFRRALVQTWLAGFLPKNFNQNKILFEIISDAYLSLIWGKLETQDPVLAKKIDPNISLRWLDDILTERELCDSAWRPIERLDLCEDLRSTLIEQNRTADNLNALSVWSLRPLVVKQFWSYYKSLSPIEKISFVKSWSQYVSSASKYFDNFPDEVDFDSLQLVANFTVAQLFDKKIKSIGFDLDFYVDLDRQQFKPDEFADLLKLSVETKHNILIRDGDNFVKIPSLQKFPVGYVRPKVKKQVLVSCEKPTFDKILNQKALSGRVLFVERCDHQQIQVGKYLTEDIEGFANANPGHNFMLFHIPSIKLATQYWSLDAKKSIEAAELNLPNEVKANVLGWESKTLSGSHKIKAALPVVEWVRWAPLTKTTLTK